MTEPRSSDAQSTPEGHTQEKPAAGELGKTGTPGAGLTPEVPHAADAEAVAEGHAPAGADAVAHHDAVTHMDTHTAISDDDRGHLEPRLGPIDWPAWGYAVAGVLVALIVVGLLAFKAS